MHRLTVTSYRLASPKLSAPLSIALVSDLHGTCFGPRQEILLDAVRREEPDLVLLCGDILDPAVSPKGSLILLKALSASYPCFFVSGNHEEWTRQMPRLRNSLSRLGIRPLRGETISETIAGQRIELGGVDDPHAFTLSHHSLRLSKKWVRQLVRCERQRDPEHFSILLSHRPELVTYYAGTGFDLIACGHAHGGQIRLPFCPGGLFAPHQGFFPRYAGGLYRLGDARLAVSRGLCINRLPRIGNPPELVVIHAQPEAAEMPDASPQACSRLTGKHRQNAQNQA